MRSAAVRVRIKGSRVYADQLGAGVVRTQMATASLDPTTAPFSPPASPAYQTAGMGHRSRSWRPGAYGPNASQDYALHTLVRQARDQMRINPDAGVIRDRTVSNVVGTGIIPEIADPAVQRLWNDWVRDCLIDGTLNLYGAQALAMGEVVEAGEVFVRLRAMTVEKGAVPLRLQLLEAEYLCLEKNEMTEGGGYIRQGVEFDQEGRRVAYWMYEMHPDDWTPGAYTRVPIRVPAAEILHIYRPTRAGQIRGVTWIASILDLLKDLSDYGDAELVRKKMSAMFTGFIKKPYPEGVDSAEMEKLFAQANIDNDGIGYGGLEPGTLQFLDPGEEIEFTEPSDVGGQYEAFMRQQYRSIAAAANLLYEQVTGDYANGNDRLFRAAFNEFCRRARQVQSHIMIFQFCEPIWRRWVFLGRLAGLIPADFDAGSTPWVPEAWPYINPVQDVAAKVAEIRSGLNSRTRVVGERGGKAADIDADNARDQERAVSLGLVYDSNPKQVDDKGQKQAVDGTPEEPA